MSKLGFVAVAQCSSDPYRRSFEEVPDLRLVPVPDETTSQLSCVA